MAGYDEEGVDVAAAAQILLSLRNRKLRRWPEWEEADEFDLPPVPEGWPKRRRSSLPVRTSGAAWLKSWKDPSVQLGHRGSGASSSGEDRAWSPAPAREKRKAARRAEVLPCHGAAAGSGPSTSGGDRRASEKAKAAAAMAASSPETPFDYGVAAGSGASSSGDERLRRRRRSGRPVGGADLAAGRPAATRGAARRRSGLGPTLTALPRLRRRRRLKLRSRQRLTRRTAAMRRGTCCLTSTKI